MPKNVGVDVQMCIESADANVLMFVLKVFGVIVQICVQNVLVPMFTCRPKCIDANYDSCQLTRESKECNMYHITTSTGLFVAEGRIRSS